MAIKTLDRQRFELDVDTKMPVPELKQLLAERTSTDVEEVRVIFRGKVCVLLAIRDTAPAARRVQVLKDDKCLGDYVKEEGQTLHLVKQVYDRQPKTRGNNTWLPHPRHVLPPLVPRQPACRQNLLLNPR